MIEETVQYDAWLLRAATTAVEEGAQSLRAVVTLCKGADPVAVRRALCASGSVRDVGASLEELDSALVLDAAVEPLLPPPHPLDYEWRFTQSGASAMLDRAEGLGGGDLLLLGATTVAIAAGRRRWSGRVLAVDQSEAVVEAARRLSLPVELILGDVAHLDESRLRVDVVVVDPPWYVDSARVFVQAAVGKCRMGGHVLASLPGEGTRPGVNRELEELTGWCHSLGLELVEIIPQSVGYETPLFERNAFRAAGLRGDCRSWRRGDLWVFRRSREAVVGPLLPTSTQHKWDEICIGQMRVRFRSEAKRSGNAALVTLVDGDILPTVSRRDPRRERARVWTSGNRVFGCDDPGTLRAAARAQVGGRDEIAAAAAELGRFPTHAEQMTILAACDYLTALSNREWNEQAEDTANQARSARGTA